MNVESVVKHMIKHNNYSIRTATPAIVVGVSELKDGLIDVKPLVNYTNPYTRDTIEYGVLKSVRVVYPSTQSSTICFPVKQGDTVDLIFQSDDISKFTHGNKEQHNPTLLTFGNLLDCVAVVGFETMQDSCFNANNYSTDFDLNDLNIVHNKNTANEASIKIKQNGEINITSKSNVDINGVTLTPDGDILIKGKSLFNHMTTHTHIDSKGGNTTPPQ